MLPEILYESLSFDLTDICATVCIYNIRQHYSFWSSHELMQYCECHSFHPAAT